MPPIVFLYLNWLQGLIEKRTYFQGIVLMITPVILAFIIVLSMKLSIGWVVLSGLWAWPLQILHHLHWKNQS